MRILLFISIFIGFGTLSAQESYADSVYKDVTAFKSIKAALENPDEVIKLVLKRDRLDSIPPSIYQFKNLEYLDLSSNRIDSIPDEITQLKNLKVLSLRRNKINAIPKSIYELKELRVLDLGANNFDYMPKGIDNLSFLRELDLWNTGMTTIPIGLEDIKPLWLLDLRGISLNFEQQEEIYELMPEVKIFMSPPCNCSF